MDIKLISQSTITILHISSERLTDGTKVDGCIVEILDTKTKEKYERFLSIAEHRIINELKHLSTIIDDVALENLMISIEEYGSMKYEEGNAAGSYEG